MIININQNSDEFKMLNDNILVKLDNREHEVDKKTESGIIIQMASNRSEITDRNTFGRVNAIGSKVRDVKVNDFVFYHITNGVDVKFRDGDFIIISEDRILGCSK